MSGTLVYITNEWRWGKSVTINLSNGKGAVEIDYETGGNTGYICNLILAGSERKRGIGRELMESAERDILREGRCWANLRVEADKERLINWYESQGYRRIMWTAEDTVGEEEGYVRMFKQLANQ